MIGAIRQVLESRIDDYTAPREWEIAGVTVYYKPDPSGASVAEWREVLEEWLPQLRDVGWTDELRHIKIADAIASGNAVGQYNSSRTIYLENDAHGTTGVTRTKADILVHEFIHHAHLTLNGFEGSKRTTPCLMKLREDISYYAGTDIGESITEIGVAIVKGEDVPEWAHEYYEEKDGPQGVYEL